MREKLNIVKSGIKNFPKILKRKGIKLKEKNFCIFDL
jgi:hypothetical protein